MDVHIETPADLTGIRAVEVEAFPTGREADLVDQLRADSDAVFSLVATVANEVVGHVMFSRMRAPLGTLGLGPVAVLPAHRRMGVAAGLIRDGLKRASESGWRGVFVYGNPAYYRRFGFDPSRAVGFSSPYAGPHLMALALQSAGLPSREGRLEYPAAFAAFE
jgi:putative acetyltransferase